MRKGEFDHALGRQAGLEDQGIGFFLHHRGNGRFEFIRAADHHDGTDFGSSAGAGAMDLFEQGLRKRWIGGIGNHADATCGRQHVAKQLDAFAVNFRAQLGQASDICAGPGKALDQTGHDRIARQDDDRDFARGFFRG